MIEFFQWFLNLGAIVVLPVLIFVFGLILRTSPKKAFLSGLTVGIGFVGLNLVIDLLSSGLGPAAQAMVERFGLSLTSIDVGWPAAAAISYGTVLGSLAIPIGIAINVVLLVFGLTKTLNVDIWNYWHAAFISSLVYVVTGNFALGLFTTVAYMLMIYLLSDILAPKIRDFYGFPGITFTHGTAIPGFLFALPLNWIFDRIPGFNKLKADPESIQKRFGIFGDSAVMGLMIGLVMGALAGYGFPEVCQLGVKTAAVMILMPRMVALLMEGLSPISEAASEYVKNKFPGRDLYIGMDAALSVGHPSVLSASLLLVPITIILSVVLPGNTTLPFGDLAAIPFLVCLMVTVFRGNIVRTVVGGTIYIATTLYVSSWASGFVTTAAKAANFDLGGNSNITTLTEGGLWTTFVYMESAQKLGFIGIGVLAAIFLAGLVYVNKIKSKKEEQIEDKLQMRG